MTATIDIIIPTYNGAALLPTCLDALRAQTRRDFRITLVDDGGNDETPTLLERHYPEVALITLSANRGLAGAVNAGISVTSAPYVVLLNNDTEAAPTWLDELVGTLERHPDYAFASSKLRLFDRRDYLHSAGDFYRADGEPGSRGVWERDDGQYDTLSEVFGPCAGAAAYRRSALEQLSEARYHYAAGRRRALWQIFDEDLVMYCEDVDLNLRARRQGMRTIFVPAAVVYHRLSATGGGTLASYYCGRNFALVWVKNMPTPLVRRYWRHLLTSQLGFTLQSLRHLREPAARARLRGQLAALLRLHHFWQKRRHTSAEEQARLTAAIAPPRPARVRG